ncbi:phospholipase-like protein [Tanacetum coccineum]
MLLVGGETENVPLYYHMYDNFQIQFGREEFCLVTGLKFGVEYSDDYDDKDKPIPFRRRVFPSRLDGKRITGKDVEELIDSNSFKKLDDDDAVSLCCIGILQLVLLGLEDRRPVPNWILRLANDRDGWDDYPWGSYVWPTLYYNLKDANVKRWLPLYATESTNEDGKKSYSLLGFTWAFKTWILEMFRLGPNEYYTRHMRYPRIVAWTSNKKFYRPMLRDFLHGRVPAERLIPDEVEAGSGWWLSSRAYFDGCVTEPERRPPHINRQNHYEVPSELYRDFQEQRSGLDQMMKQGQNIFEKMKKYMEDLNVGTGANREPIIADQHYGISDLSGFQSIQGGPSSFQTPTNNSIFNMGTPTNWQTSMPSQPGSSNWQSQMPAYTPTPMPSQPGSSNWQSQMPAYTPTPNWQPPIPSHSVDAGLCDPRPRRVHRPSVYMQSPYTPLPATTELPKKRVGRTKKNSKNDNLSPLNLGNAFAHDNVGGDDVLITGEHDTGIYFTYENVDPNKVTRQEYNDFTDFILNPFEVYLDCYMMGYIVPAFFWRQLVPHLCMPRSHSEDNEGWLSGDQMNVWIEILIRSRRQDADWTVSKSGTTCVHPENNRFIIQTDPHIIGMLDGSTRPYPSWRNVNWVYMPINVGGNHWVTGAVNLPHSVFYVFDSMESESTKLLLEHQIKAWTPVINGLLQMRGYFDGSERPYHNFILSYNKGWGFSVPQQANFKDCGVITCWLIARLCAGHVPVVPRHSERYWENIRYEMGELFYKCRCENTRYCGYD